MAATVRLPILSIVNEVQRRLGVNPTNTVGATRHSIVLLQLLNEVIAEVNDYGYWAELYEEVIVTVSASVNTYAVKSATREVHSLIEVSFDNDAAQLENRPLEDIRRLTRVGSQGATGTPRQYAVIGVDVSGNPEIRVFPRPGTTQAGKTFNIAIQGKEPLFTTADGAVVPVYPGNLLIMGLYAKGLLEENGGEITNQYQRAFQEFERMARESQRRFTSDTERVINFTPHGFG